MQVSEMEIGAQSYNFCVESDGKRIQYAQKDVFTVLELQINDKKFSTLKFFTFSYLLYISKL